MMDIKVLKIIGKIDKLRLSQDGCHFPDNILKCILLNENVRIPIKFSLKFGSKGPVNNISALLQIMAWCQPDDKPLSGLWTNDG